MEGENRTIYVMWAQIDDNGRYTRMKPVGQNPLDLFIKDMHMLRSEMVFFLFVGKKNMYFVMVGDSREIGCL